MSSRYTDRLVDALAADPGVHGAHPLGPRVLRREADPDHDAEQRAARYPRGLGAHAAHGGAAGQRAAAAVRGLQLAAW